MFMKCVCLIILTYKNSKLMTVITRMYVAALVIDLNVRTVIPLRLIFDNAIILRSLLIGTKV